MYNKKFDIWFAGFWEGEGTIRVRKMNKGLGSEITVSQGIHPKRNVLETFEKIKKTYGGTLSRTQHNYKNAYELITWGIYNNDGVLRMIDILLPYANIRKNQLLDMKNKIIKERKWIKTYIPDKLLFSDTSCRELGKMLDIHMSTVSHHRSAKNNYIMLRRV